MPHPARSHPLRALRGLCVLLLLVGACAGGAPAAAAAPTSGWVWPVAPFRLVAPYVQPVHDYAPGHRGIDLESLDGFSVRSPADGVIAFVGDVAGRPVLTIDHGAGLVSTLEPVSSTLTPGTRVLRGEMVGDLSLGGHAASGALHFGVRLDGEYINPLLLLGGVPRAVLLPCCD
ncbi:murein hydrolase activator EnvC family protein [Microbacterium sp. B2969]|uniref:Murein hydrolase activator EnvC family protein n=1 Tax=Microbacterium alkaliflavum TaxID=3248839 RepID=A0ABW7Q942_9MICO